MQSKLEADQQNCPPPPPPPPAQPPPPPPSLELDMHKCKMICRYKRISAMAYYLDEVSVTRCFVRVVDHHRSSANVNNIILYLTTYILYYSSKVL